MQTENKGSASYADQSKHCRPLGDAMKMILCISLMTLTGLLSGCGTLSNGRRWGEDATLLPGWGRIRSAAVNAVSGPGTWLPVTGAAVLQIGHMDERLSDWASDRTPFFGSHDRAGRLPGDLRNAARIAHYATILATPSGDAPAEWFRAKAKGATVGLAALSLTGLTTDFLKSKTKRTRPNGGDTRSFPSSNASGISAASTLAYRNIQCLNIPDPAKTASAIGFASLSVLSAWGRVEAGGHYPSDVLVGLALGHSVAVFLQDAFLGLDAEKFLIEAAPVDGGLLFSVAWKF